MNDPASPRKPKGWPLFAISLLVVLLAGFLILKWRKKDEGPVVVKEPPPAVHVDTPAEATKPSVPEKPEVPAGDPKAGEFELRVAEFRKALEAKQWDQAAAAVAAARKLRADAPELKGADELISEGRKKEEAERVEAAAKSERKFKRERAWAVEKDRIRKEEWERDLWDAALKSLEKIRQEYPEIERDQEYLTFQDQLKVRQAEADKYFKQDFAAAQGHFAAARYSQAIGSAEGALQYYPERKPIIREFQDRVREIQSEKTMVRIPETACWIGSNDQADEKPLRQVKLPAFLIDKYEVTKEDYAAFVAATGREAPPYWLGRRPPKGRERHPVVMITWDDAAAYAKWAGKRLPSAEEWEVAARGPDKREFPWGSVFLEKEDKFPCNCLEYWQVNKTEAPGTRPVDEFENGESAFGVYGMGGNVWEWTSTATPALGSRPPPEFRILKGGSFMTPQKALRCANVYPEDPRIPHPDVGFRCARDIK
jgi:formylglycine-generating enzyme required for sulfatase activity